MKCSDIQTIIKNYESYVIKRRGSTITPRPFLIRPLAQKLATASASVRLVRAPSVKLQATSSESLKLQAASIKPQAQRLKLKTTSNKLVDHGPFKKFQAP